MCPRFPGIHDLRHAFASNLFMKNVDIPTVQSLLGHKNWNTTLIYSHQTKAHGKTDVEKLVLKRVLIKVEFIMEHA